MSVLTLCTAQQDAAQLKQLTKAEMVEFYSTRIHPTSPTRSKLIVQLIARGTSSETKEADTTNDDKAAPAPSNGTDPVVIESVGDFKAGLGTTAGPRPVRDIGEFEDIDRIFEGTDRTKAEISARHLNTERGTCVDLAIRIVVFLQLQG
ncbi:Uu.00g077720.m01.CDS01 [Anthostomella pinea]|uniref:Uu.00g077720.m01.CDS01 n=1 Tax=Anthostomella pinea TaxID=933095 RepID=A0AAI8YIY8_9PEZI|nr:Uu.00g077720.m01.CDS01 [Anthostomella pinea]